MDSCDYNEIRALLSQAGFRFSKSKGQNFLTASWVPERIAERAGIDRNTGVVEIGPGAGCLTQRLARLAGKVVAFELDGRLRPVLSRTLEPYDNIDVIFGDVMRADLRRETEERLGGLRPALCANLPYNITTPVLKRIFEARCFDTVTVMVQREVALRMCAAAGDKDYGAFTLLTQWYARPELCFTVGAECFTPRPKVTSAVVHMKMRAQPPVAADEAALFRIIRAAFNQRRKTLSNALGGLYSRETAQKAAAACGFSPDIRGEALSLADFAALTEELAKYDT